MPTHIYGTQLPTNSTKSELSLNRTQLYDRLKFNPFQFSSFDRINKLTNKIHATEQLTNKNQASDQLTNKMHATEQITNKNHATDLTNIPFIEEKVFKIKNLK